MDSVKHSNHPVLRSKIDQLRDQTISSKQVRELTQCITHMLAYEALKDIEIKSNGQVVSLLLLSLVCARA